MLLCMGGNGSWPKSKQGHFHPSNIERGTRVPWSDPCQLAQGRVANRMLIVDSELYLNIQFSNLENSHLVFYDHLWGIAVVKFTSSLYIEFLDQDAYDERNDVLV
jgi:hypothetical protein